MSSRTEIWNGYEDALAAELSSGELTNMFVGSIPVGWVGPVYLCIEPDVPANREWVRANDVNAGLGRFENLTRNLEGSAGDLTHPPNSVVRAVVTRQLVDDIFTDIEATELELSQHKTDGGDPHAQAGYLKVGDTDALYLKIAGGQTMTGYLTLFADPLDGSHAATKNYVDAVDPSGVYLPLDGSDPMTGELDMGTNKIVGLVDGVNAADAATVNQLVSVSTDLGNHIADAGDPHAAAGYLTETDADAFYLPLDGLVPMAGPLNMGNQKISAVADGTLDDDAVSKLQMENAISSAISTALTDYDTATVSDAKNDGKMQSYYTKDDDPRAVASRRIFIQSADPGAMSNDDIWHDLP